MNADERSAEPQPKTKISPRRHGVYAEKIFWGKGEIKATAKPYTEKAGEHGR
jgi:hypothetical protein